MRKPFNGDYPLTQGFGVNKDDYEQFGLQGHDGLDFGLPTGTPVVAPHGGKIIEANFDPTGYGNYIKIEDEKQGSVLAHLQRIDVSVGFLVSEGVQIGLSNNTGNSTGPHLHWGYYLFPRDRSNGFAGFIDQSSLLDSSTQYVYKYKVGDILEPTVDIPVYPTPDFSSAAYGHIGFKFQAKIIDMRNGFYNVDQTAIGGGTGWVNAASVDSTPQYVARQEAVPVEPSLPQTAGEYTQEQYNTVLESVKEANDQLLEANKTLTAFKALGLSSVEDVNNFTKSKDDTILGLNKQLSEVLQRNIALTKMVQDKETEDATAIDEGIKAMQQVGELKGNLADVAKMVDSEPKIHSIISNIINLKDIAEKFFSHQKKMNDILSKPQVTDPPASNQSGLDWLMKFLGLSKEVTN